MSSRQRPRGIVYLVGAGPGDPRLLTLRGAECLRRAQVVLFDRLVSRELLAWAPRGSELIDRGRRGDETALTQEAINQTLIARAEAGNIVVRLKGGDPLVFGRGGEEAQALVAAGISFEVVPGVTSVVGVPAYAGIPLTHRDLAPSVTVVSGHDAAAGPDVPWEQLALPDTTLVLMMSLRSLPKNLERLRKAGVDATTPAAVVESGATPRQRVVTGTVADLAKKVAAARIRAPALTIVGRVVALREQLCWADKLPLSGKQILITRAREQADAVAAPLRELGAEPVLLPTIELRPPADFAALDAAIGQLSSYEWLLFTSANGVSAFFERLATCRLDARRIGGAKIASIGPGTSRALRAVHVEPDLEAKEQRAEGLLEALRRQGLAGKRFLLPRAARARELLPDEIEKAGGKVDVVAAYQSVVPAPDPAAAKMLRAGCIDLITFSSSSAVENFQQMGLRVGRAAVAAIGPITRGTCDQQKIPVAIEPKSSTIPALVEAIVTYFSSKDR